MTENLPKKDRLELLFKSLRNANAANNLQEAWVLVDSLLKAIEDNYTTLPYDRANNYGQAERMYIPPLTLPGIWSVSGQWKSADLFAHKLRLSSQGGIEILVKSSNEKIFSKDGAGHC